MLGRIDRNGLQITGASEEVMAVENLLAKWQAFGWDVQEVDGNDMDALVEALETKNETKKPRMIIAKTVKGKGISFTENRANWHHKVPTSEELEQALTELNQQLEELTDE